MINLIPEPKNNIEAIVFPLLRKLQNFLFSKAYWKFAGTVIAVILLYKLLNIVGLILAVVLVYYLYFKNKKNALNDDDELDFLGDARWAKPKDFLIGTGTPQNPKPILYSKTGHPESGDLILGEVIVPTNDKKKTYVNDLISLTGEGHILTVASTGAGKGTNVVIPNLFIYKQPVIVLDPKGENFIKTHYFREKNWRQEICLVDPFGEVPKEIEAKIEELKRYSGNQGVDEAISYFKDLLPKTKSYGQYLKGFNPLQVIEDLYTQKKYDEIIDEADVIADMIVVRATNEKDPHWNDKAKSLIRGIILFITFSDYCQKKRSTYPLNLSTVKRVIGDTFSSNEKRDSFIQLCRMNEFLHGVADTVTLIAEQERGSVLSTVLRHMDFLNSKNVQDSLSRNDFQLDDIRIHPKTIYLVIPASKITSYSRLARLWIATIKSSLERINDGYRDTRPVLFMLDEVAQLGRMEPLKQAVSLSRSYGMKLWFIFQDIAQMKNSYPDDEWRTFFSNTKVQQFFGVSASDIETQEFVSKASGQQTIAFVTQSYSEGTSRGASYGSNSSNSEGGGSYGSNSNYSSGSSQNYSLNQQIQARALVNPDEVPRLTHEKIIIFSISRYPIQASKLPYYEMHSFIKRYPFELDLGVMKGLKL